MSEGLVTNSVVQAPEQVQGADALVAPQRPRDALDHAVDFCERMLPDLPMLGVAMVLFVLYLAASGSDFGVPDDAFAAQQEAAAAASASPRFVPFLREAQMNESRFHFDARWAVDGFFPMPCYQSERASELLSRLLYHAVSASPRLRVLDHWISCKIDEQIEQAAYEVLRTRFQMPCEGGEMPIQTIDRIALYPDALHYSVNDTYGAYLLFAGVCDDALRRAMSTTAEPSRRLPLDEADRTFVVHALQSLHRERTTTWNCHAIHALKNNRLVQSPVAFGLADLERILAKLDATTAP